MIGVVVVSRDLIPFAPADIFCQACRTMCIPAEQDLVVAASHKMDVPNVAACVS